MKRHGKRVEKEHSLRKGTEALPRKKPKWKRTSKPLQAIVDTDDIHCLMIGASGVGKTAFFLYPNREYNCTSGMSFLALDTKGDLARNYGTIAPNATAIRWRLSICVIPHNRAAAICRPSLTTIWTSAVRREKLGYIRQGGEVRQDSRKGHHQPRGDASNYG